ncbi:hypothetical protein F5887DRAFT_986545 [Amanita rubescens]|nr:hypothetical protein F5887DRAFT_1001159 [Amanita rubescens]KAF8336787.1 hypothetical protein F5887DRAFT_986545 [Amanita rubescens]
MQNEPSSEQLRQKFRSLTTLLRVVLSLRIGYPTSSGDAAPSSLTNSHHVLEAIASILIIDLEVVAVMAFSDDSGGLVMQNQAPTSPSASTLPSQVDIEQNDAVPCDIPTPLISPVVANDSTNGLGNLHPDIDTDTNNVDFQNLKVATVSNSHSPNGVSQTEFSLLEGKDLWPEVKAGKFENVLNSQQGLSDHLKTICSYLQVYKSSTTKDRSDIATAFSRYLIITCWRKMYRRISSWSSLGLLHTLRAFDEGTLQGMAHKAETVDDDADEDRDTRQEPNNDRSLALFLSTSNQETLELLMAEDSKALQAATRLQAVACESNNIYRPDTVVDFHIFFTSLLINYAKQLADLAKVGGWGQRGKSVDATKILSSARIFLPFALALYNVAHSNATRKHLKMLNNSGQLFLPTAHEASIYMEFGRTHGIFFGRTDTTAQAPANEAQNDDPEDVSNEENDLCTTESTTTTTVFRRWIMTFVSHLSAKRVLEKHVSEVLPMNAEVDLRLLSVKRPQTSPDSWDQMKDIIRKAVEKGNTNSLSMTVLDIATILDTLTNLIKDCLSSPNSTDGRHPIIQLFELRDNQVVPRPISKFRGSQHCEAILASFSMFYAAAKLVDDNAELLNITKKLNNVRIGVSKLCCPVCWDLLSILQNQRSKKGLPKNLFVHGRHPTLHEVDLPDWLPSDVLTAMVNWYESKLYEGLCNLEKMVESQTERRSHRRNPSGQSERSVKSDTSDNLEPKQFKEIVMEAIQTQAAAAAGPS